MNKMFDKIKIIFSLPLVQSFIGIFLGSLCFCLTFFCGFRVGSSSRREAFAAEVTSYHWTSPLYNPRVGSLGPYNNSQSSPFYIECNTLDPDVFIIKNVVDSHGFLDEGYYDGNGNYIMYFQVFVYPGSVLTIPVWFEGYDSFLNSDGDFVLTVDYSEYREQYIQDSLSLFPFLQNYGNILSSAIDNSASGSWESPVRFCQFTFLVNDDSNRSAAYLFVAFPDLSVFGSPVSDFIVSRSFDSQESYDLGYSWGYKVGKNIGSGEGYMRGRNEGVRVGYDEGYRIGIQTNLNDLPPAQRDQVIQILADEISPFNAVRSGVDNLLDIQIFPGFKLSTLFLISVGLLCVGLLIRFAFHG